MSTNVRTFGVTGNGITDDAPAIQSAIDASSVGDTLYFPVGVYRIGTTLTVNKSLKLQGPGVWNLDGLTWGMFGDGAWPSDPPAASAVLATSLTSGAIIESSTNAHKIAVEGLTFLGIGDAIRTTMGLRAGSDPTGVDDGGQQALVRDCVFLNLHAGIEWNFVELSLATSLDFFGCDTGFLSNVNTNANTFINVNTHGCNVGMRFNGALQNTIVGGAMQGCGIGLLTENNADNLVLDNVYFENTGATYALKIQSNGCVINGCSSATTDDNFLIAGNDTKIVTPRYSVGTLTITGDHTIVIGRWTGTVSMGSGPRATFAGLGTNIS